MKPVTLVCVGFLRVLYGRTADEGTLKRSFIFCIPVWYILPGINRNWFQLLKGQRSFLCCVSFEVDNRDFDDRGSVNFPRFHLSFKGKRLGVFWGVFPKRLIVVIAMEPISRTLSAPKARGVFPQTLHCIVSGSLMRCKKERGITTASTGPTKNPSIKSGERQPQFLFIRSKNWWAN